MKLPTFFMSWRALFLCLGLSPSTLLAGAVAQAQVVSPTTEFLIITQPTLRPAFEGLAEARSAEGIRTEVVDLSEIPRGGTLASGRDTAEQVRVFLTNLVAEGSLRYVLLGGDYDVIPTRFVAPAFINRSDFTRHATPTDLYFSALDGNWDADLDRVFGEIPWRGTPDVENDEVDFTPEIHVGRAPVRTLAEAEIFVKKTLAFDATDTPQWRQRALVLSDWTYTDQSFEPHAEGLIAAAGWSDQQVTRLYAGPTREHPLARELTWESFLKAWTQAEHALVAHVGRGTNDALALGDGTGILETDDVPQLKTERPPILLTLSDGAVLDRDGYLKQMLLAPDGGCVAGISFSHFSFISPNERYLAEFLRAFYGPDRVSLGDAMSMARGALAPSINQGFVADPAFGWILLGDPTLGLSRGSDDDSHPLVSRTAWLSPNYPNPFNPATTLRFRVEGERPRDVRLRVYDVAGRLVDQLVDAAIAPGDHQVTWRGHDRDGVQVASGIYSAELWVDGVRHVRKMTLIR